MACDTTVYARAGLVGNPSDGYYGKTISFTVRNFCARVSLYESTDLEIIPSLRDRSRYDSIEELVEDVKAYGYYGGIRLMKAAIRKFADYCQERGIQLPRQNFSMRYRSSIPRHVGLAGSSALVIGALKCLMEFYDVAIPKPLLPTLALEVEAMELGIAAGLQDRVIQVYENCVYMDFDREYMEAHGHGKYEEMDPALLPNLFLGYRTDFSESSEVFHNPIRERWLRGDPEVVQAMKEFAHYAEQVRNLLLAGRGHEIGPWLNRNFDLRRSLFRLNPADIEMVERARATGAYCKFAGSGGAIVGMYEDEGMYQRLLRTFEGTSVVLFKPEITEPSPTAQPS